ncbi:16S rRNA (uracil(1498)-N(3))-methyltransferase [Campylobacter sp. LR264d]|uniref:16S rRNA (uracil(1498)-N(3))-methyltransferase n=1 Tax=Campylobacter sp. LR264d TaxID=2593544 RepID=UPI001238706C|nr:16S rRNA (uracil(1498)-N(3))-methyltransferase [Campylobacter sp. LR264d]KAA6231434.1 16S rRNA (uracil(1498)-N(3))-methyltransferase [Campylobacter sp. LR264d]
MQFYYNETSGTQNLLASKENLLHFKTRHVKNGEILAFRNLKDDFLYEYELSNLSKYDCSLSLKNKILKTSSKNNITLALGVIDDKILEKTLPFLNELNLYKLILVYTHFSQRNFKIDFARVKRILINSCQQCGRSNLMQLESFENIEKFINAYKNVVLVDFNGEKKEFTQDEIYFIGAEGGFNDDERRLFTKKISLTSPNILKSQTAIISIAAKLLI